MDTAQAVARARGEAEVGDALKEMIYKGHRALGGLFGIQQGGPKP